MNIDINIYRITDSTGEGVAYHPEVHWSIDESDPLDPTMLKVMGVAIQNAIIKGVGDAMKAHKDIIGGRQVQMPHEKVWGSV